MLIERHTEITVNFSHDEIIDILKNHALNLLHRQNHIKLMPDASIKDARIKQCQIEIFEPDVSFVMTLDEI